ncbi:uncharacterized protein C3orf20-like isoform X3 [Mugil cephalus]|uniref:uncharacterized protein C3orf20-like isoform X3 n=1 Tax=Mugil cephalus TaxID=48193 RepID=UPI001FB5959B|nr:uncharacterized protein C3orf20-like isoform X3 [Mugil cephalus]
MVSPTSQRRTSIPANWDRDEITLATEIMTSSDVRAELSTRPLYFFDQPSRRNQTKGVRSRMLYFNVATEVPHLEGKIQSYQEDEDSEVTMDEPNKEILSGETRADGEPDTSSAVGAALNSKECDPMDSYKRAAPGLLTELARLLSRHKWPEKGCIPRGIVNILNYSWNDLTAGAAQFKRRKSRGSLTVDQTPRQLSANTKEETAERNSCAVGNVGSSERKPQAGLNARVKKRKQNSGRAHKCTTASFSISSGSCKDPGWIIQPKQPCPDEPQRISLCQWVVKRLQAAGNPEKPQTAEQDLNKLLLLRHYGDAKARLKDRSRQVQPPALVNGMPQIPQVKQRNQVQHKLHYRISDGSSFIYYPSGCVAVCQSHSGLPRGGFYTNVFSDGDCPVILATITAFGRGAATHPLSSTITTVWDQDGGFICDHDGNITKEWSWQNDLTARDKIVIQLSDEISVRLFSGTSAVLSFRCDSESVQLPLPSLSNIHQSDGNFSQLCLQTEGKFTSDFAQDLLLVRKTKYPADVLESKRNPTLTPVSVRSQEVLQMVRDVEGPEDPSAPWRRGGCAGRELKRLQQRVRNAVEDWLDYYRVAIGIKCRDAVRMPDAPPRTRARREVQSAALPSLNPPERADAKPAQAEEGGDELQELHRHLSASPERPPVPPVKLPRSVILPSSPESQTSTAAHIPAVASFTPSVPLTVCPALLRAALLGERQWRRCCCSTALMPVVTDLEYDAFVTGQPPHSHQILVVCVTPPSQPASTCTVQSQDELEELYRRRNKHRSMPCTQCQMDSFRLVRYEMSMEKDSCGFKNILLQQRHNAGPGMVLMYIRGTLLFVGYMFSAHSCSARDLQQQISRTRADYRLGLSLPKDYKFSDTVKTPGDTDAHNSSNAARGERRHSDRFRRKRNSQCKETQSRSRHITPRTEELKHQT